MNRIALLVLCLLSLPSLSVAQTGRYYVTPEAFVGYSRVVYVGKIVELEPTDYKADEDAPLTRAQAIGDPYRLVFEVAETIRGDEVKRLELVLSLQSHHLLDYMRDLGTEIMLVAGPDRFKRLRPGPDQGADRCDTDRPGARCGHVWSQALPAGN